MTDETKALEIIAEYKRQDATVDSGNLLWAAEVLAGACEAKRAEVDHWSQKYGHYVDKWNDSDRLRNQRDLELKAERAKGARLVQALRYAVEGIAMWRKYQSPGNIAEVELHAREAIAEYEAGK